MRKPTEFREARKRAGLTQEQVAERSGLSPRTVATADVGGKVSAASSIRLRAALLNGQGGATSLQPTQPDPYQPAPVPAPERREVEWNDRKVTIDTRRYSDLPVVSPIQGFDTVTAVREALLAFQQGQFMQAADLVEAMQADDRIKGVVAQRVDGLLGLPFGLEAAEEDNALAAQLSKEAGDLWPRIAPDHVLRDLWKWGRFLGYGVAEKLYDTKAKEGWVPQLKLWHPRYLWWNWTARCLMLNTQDGPVSIREDDPHWVVYAPFGYYRGWMEGMIRALAIPWLFRQYGYRDWGRYNEVHGIPIRAIIEPSEWEDADKQQALQQVAKLASESIVRLPQQEGKGGFDLKLIEATSQTYESFKLALDQANSSIAIVILGQNLTTEVKGGAYSAAQVHERVAAAIIQSDSKTLGATLRERVLVEWAALNHGPEAADVAPRPSWDTEPPEDKGARATALLTAAQGVATLRKTQMPFDYAKICEQQGLPLDPTKEIPDFVPPPPPTPFGGKDGQDEDGDDEEAQARGKNLQARIAALALRETVVAAKLGRRERAPLQGQVYADQLTDAGREQAARILAGDVRAMRKIIANAKPGPDGKIDGDAIKAELLKAYKDMEPDRLARVLSNCTVLAKLSGLYSVTKEVVSE